MRILPLYSTKNNNILQVTMIKFNVLMDDLSFLLVLLVMANSSLERISHYKIFYIEFC